MVSDYIKSFKERIEAQHRDTVFSLFFFLLENNWHCHLNISFVLVF